MDSKRKNSAKEPSEVYETSQKANVNQEEMHPILVKLLEKSIEQADRGEGISHEEMQKRIKEKYPFLK